MTAALDHRPLPLVAVISRVPLLGEVVAEELRDLADVRFVPTGRCDIATLLSFLEPDAVVIDSADSVAAAKAHADESGCGLVHVELRGCGGLRVLRRGAWTDHSSADLPAHGFGSILLAGALRGRNA
jgi:hypothetical protein